GANRLQSWEAGIRAATAANCVFIDPRIQVCGDWIEGITDALERSTTSIVVPRIQPVETWSDNSPPLILFEQRRGRYYGIHTAISVENLEQFDCWACRRANQEVFQMSYSGAAEQVEDTLVFSLTPTRSQKAIALPDNELPQSSSRNASIVIPVFNN